MLTHEQAAVYAVRQSVDDAIQLLEEADRIHHRETRALVARVQQGGAGDLVDIRSACMA
jgi:hypothetical protein